MVLESSWGRFEGALVTSEEVVADEHVLKRLEELLPLAKVREAVDGFYANANARVGRAAFADLEDDLADVEDSHARAELRARMEAGPDVESEAIVARAEIVRYWVNTLLEAWTELRVAKDLPLDAALRPQNRGSRAWDGWDEHRREDLESLLASVALEGDAIAALTEAFRGSVAAAGGIDLPSNLRLVWSHDHCVVRSR